MEILGIGPLELFFILIIALIVLGPQDMVKAGRTIGRFLRTVVTSPTWRTVQQTSRELRYLPNKLMREAGLEDLANAQNLRREVGMDRLEKDMKKWQADISDWTTAQPTIGTPAAPLAPGQNAPDEPGAPPIAEPAPDEGAAGHPASAPEETQATPKEPAVNLKADPGRSADSEPKTKTSEESGSN